MVERGALDQGMEAQMSEKPKVLGKACLGNRTKEVMIFFLFY